MRDSGDVLLVQSFPAGRPEQRTPTDDAGVGAVHAHIEVHAVCGFEQVPERAGRERLAGFAGEIGVLDELPGGGFHRTQFDDRVDREPLLEELIEGLVVWIVQSESRFGGFRFWFLGSHVRLGSVRSGGAVPHGSKSWNRTSAVRLRPL